MIEGLLIAIFVVQVLQWPGNGKWATRKGWVLNKAYRWINPWLSLG